MGVVHDEQKVSVYPSPFSTQGPAREPPFTMRKEGLVSVSLRNSWGSLGDVSVEVWSSLSWQYELDGSECNAPTRVYAPLLAYTYARQWDTTQRSAHECVREPSANSAKGLRNVSALFKKVQVHVKDDAHEDALAM